jgi:bifunctional UDP-N-acetylglucosamine pyrophosphorylase / glucosamine-1-phosphate N-acetyltransferase
MRSRIPKLLHPLCGRLMIGWPVAAATAAGAGRIVVVDAPGERLRPELDDHIAIAIQHNARGTGDAVKAAQVHFSAGSTVVVLNGDVPLIAPATIEALVTARESAGAAATIVTAVLDDPSGYGRVVRDGDGTVVRVVETKQAGDATEEEWAIQEVNAGIYAFDSALLADALAEVTSDNSQGEYYLPDVLAILRAGGGTVTALVLDDTGEILQINDRRQLAEVRAEAQRRINEAHMLAGVTIVDPGATIIDIGVTLEPDAVIAPFTSLHGTTSIAAGATIGPHSTVIDTCVGEDAKVLHSYVTGATIEAGASVGPFAYLRPGAILREGAKAGTFVEIKNSDIGPGSKVPHLSYIGDATIGPGANLGAATITANYDGQNKHRTTIGAGVRTGVDTTLMAPVTVGDRAYTAAGSVIGQDVPPDALAGSPGVARKAQRNIEGYAERRKPPADGANSAKERH